jgi:hypothetical protein
MDPSQTVLTAPAANADDSCHASLHQSRMTNASARPAGWRNLYRRSKCTLPAYCTTPIVSIILTQVPLIAEFARYA